MKFWNDELRICTKCKKPVEMSGEERAQCPHCHHEVWFFDYRSLKPPPDLPSPTPPGLWKNPQTALLLVCGALLSLTVLVGIAFQYFASIIAAFVAIGFCAYAYLRHSEAQRLEDALKHASKLTTYAELMRNRTREVNLRYTNLLKTGDARIEQYFNDIYIQAELEKQDAEILRRQAATDRTAIGTVEQRIFDIAERFIDDHRKWSTSRMRPDPENYQRRKSELTKAFDFAASIGYEVPETIRREAYGRLKHDFREKVREHTLREEQKRIQRIAREEEKLRKERERELREAEDQEEILRQRLEEVLQEHRDAHNAEVEELQRQLNEAHEKAERAKSMAQQTKAGHVYILSNIGSFGENVFKVGMTRRTDPLLRVKELGDASVPFPFDIHAMIRSDDAPALESTLHHVLTRTRVNRVNLRKEYFRIDLDKLLELVREHHGDVEYVAEPEALEYRQSLEYSEDDVVEYERELIESGVQFEEDE